MIIDNRKNTYRIWLKKFVLTVLLVLIIIIVGFSEYFRYPVLGIDRSCYLASVGAIYLIMILIGFFRKPCFIFFSDNGEKIILRYYPARILNQKKNSIEIHKNNFVRFEIKKFFFGMYEKIILYQRFKSGVARYPDISLSAMDQNDRELLKKVLEGYSKG